MPINKDRRDIVKMLVLAGFSIYIPGCGPSEEKETAPLKKSTPKVIDDPIDLIEHAIDTNNVVYVQQADARFEELKVGFNLRVPKTPKLIALCKNTEGVAEAINLARKSGHKVAVKSGGHSFEAFSSINEGMQINLSLMNSIEWSGDDAIIQPAAILKEMYDELLPKNRVIPAGSCGTVGIGGLTMGGGYGFFGRKYGLTCDSLKQATFVDGNGEIHKVDSQDDLMWALKGGGNGNFGVVTEMTFKTHPAPASFTRHRFKAYKLDKDRTKALLKAYFEYSAKLNNSCFVAFVLNHKTMVLLITNYGEHDEALTAMIDKFTILADSADIGTPKDLATSLRTYYGVQYPIPFKNSSAGYYNDYSSIEGCIDKVLDVMFSKKGLIYQINTLGGNINNSEFEEASCYPHRAMPYLCELQAYWNEGKDPKELLVNFAGIQDILYDHGIRKQYRNYPNIDFKDWESAYFGSNYEKLRGIKLKHDPFNLFSHKQTINLN